MEIPDKIKTPDKIYLSPKIFNIGKYTIKVLTTKYRDNIEYIRTDAFIKKAENFLEMLGCGFTITDNITHTNYDKEQLIEDFKNYMKGE